MKKIIQFITFICLPLFILNSCTNDAIENLSGEYPIPEDITLTTVASQSNEKTTDGSARFFNLKLTGGNGETFSVQFDCANTWYLEARTYTIAQASAATIGNFISDHTSYSSSSCSASISDGNIVVTRTDENDYTITGVLIMSDKSVVRVHFEGNINYVEPTAEALTQVLSAKATTGSGYTTIELILATDGLSLISSAYGSSVIGSGDYADISLICSTSTLTAGTYTPIASGSEKVGTFTAGYQGSYLSWTWDAGSRYYTVLNNVSSSATYLTTGSIKVTVNGTSYTISIDSGSVFASYTGSITIK